MTAKKRSFYLPDLPQGPPQKWGELGQGEGPPVGSVALDLQSPLEEGTEHILLVDRPASALKEGLRKGHRLLACPDLHSTALGEAWANSFACQQRPVELEKFLGQEVPEIFQFTWFNHLQAGHFGDILATQAHAEGLNSIEVRNSFHALVHYLGYLQQADLCLWPYECQYTSGEDFFFYQVEFRLRRFDLEFILGALGPYSFEHPYRGQLQQMIEHSNYVDISCLHEMEKLLIAVGFDRQAQGPQAFSLRNVSVHQEGGEQEGGSALRPQMVNKAPEEVESISHDPLPGQGPERQQSGGPESLEMMNRQLAIKRVTQYARDIHPDPQSWEGVTVEQLRAFLADYPRGQDLEALAPGDDEKILALLCGQEDFLNYLDQVQSSQKHLLQEDIEISVREELEQIWPSEEEDSLAESFETSKVEALIKKALPEQEFIERDDEYNVKQQAKKISFFCLHEFSDFTKEQLPHLLAKILPALHSSLQTSDYEDYVAEMGQALTQILNELKEEDSGGADSASFDDLEERIKEIALENLEEGELEAEVKELSESAAIDPDKLLPLVKALIHKFRTAMEQKLQEKAAISHSKGGQDSDRQLQDLRKALDQTQKEVRGKELLTERIKERYENELNRRDQTIAALRKKVRGEASSQEQAQGGLSSADTEKLQELQAQVDQLEQQRDELKSQLSEQGLSSELEEKLKAAEERGAKAVRKVKELEHKLKMTSTLAEQAEKKSQSQSKGLDSKTKHVMAKMEKNIERLEKEKKEMEGALADRKKELAHYKQENMVMKNEGEGKDREIAKLKRQLEEASKKVA